MQNVKLAFGGKRWSFDLRDEADESVFNEIFKLGEYRRAQEVIESAADPIVDAGSHAGLFTIYCRALNPTVKIFAIEPEARNIKQLKTHLAVNKIDNVIVAEAALAGESGERFLEISFDSHNHKLSSQGQIVKAFSLPDFCRAQKIKKISLLKMDVEGSEREIFVSMEKGDLAVVKNVILEYHGKENARLVEEKLRQNGFGAQIYPSKFDKRMGFIFARNKSLQQ